MLRRDSVFKRNEAEDFDLLLVVPVHWTPTAMCLGDANIWNFNNLLELIAAPYIFQSI